MFTACSWTKRECLERYDAVQTCLARSIDDALSSARQFIQQFVISKIAPRDFGILTECLSLSAIIQAGLQQTSRANALRPAYGGFCAASTACYWVLSH